MRARFLFVSASLIVASCTSIPIPSTPEFVLHQALPLEQRSDGFDGSLEVLRDRRLTESDIKAFQEQDPDMNPENSPRFRSHPLESARLLLKSNDGHLVQSLRLEKAYANLEGVEIGAGKRAILITQNFGIGFGSYNGPVTKILEVGPRSMAWANARQRQGGRIVPISLMRSLKSAWDFVLASEGKDILGKPKTAISDWAMPCRTRKNSPIDQCPS